MSLTSRLSPLLAALRQGPLVAFLALFAALYGAYGTQSPFFPAFLGSRRLSAEAIGAVLAYSTAVKLVAAPLAGRLADRIGKGRLVLAAFAAATGLSGLAYLAISGVWAAALVATAWSIAIAPLAPLADALALAASDEGRAFPYGWVRGAGSAAFVAGTLVAGFAVARSGLPVIMVVSGVLFVVLALLATRLPSAPAGAAETSTGSTTGVAELLRNRPFRMLMLVAALVMGSHAMSDSFAVIRWRAAGLAPPTISLLWSLSVIAEVAVFLLIGPPLLKRIGPAGGAAIAATAGILRWSVMASTAAVPALMAVQTPAPLRHAAHRARRSPASRGDRADALRRGGDRHRQRAGDPGVRAALCASRRWRLLGHGGALRDRPAADARPRRYTLRRFSRNSRSAGTEPLICPKRA